MTTKRVRRTYRGTDAQMLIACLVQTDHLLLIQPQLALRRSRYTTAFLTDLRQELADAMKTDLGIDPHSAVLFLTSQLKSAQSSALHLLKAFYLDLRDAFADTTDKSRLRYFAALLGFRDHYRAAQTGRQQALAELLLTFNVATDDPAVRTELETDLDIAPTLITDIKAQYEFYQLNVAQEQGKTSAPAITDEIITRFNSLYRRVQAVARLAHNLYEDQPATADKFSYATIRRRMTSGARSAADEAADEVEEADESADPA